MKTGLARILIVAVVGSCSMPLLYPAESGDRSAIRHAYLVMGSRTALISEEGVVTWEHAGGSRDGFVLPNGHILVAYSDRVEEITPENKAVFSYRLSPQNREIGTTQRLYNGHTMVTELGAQPRLLEIGPGGDVILSIRLQPETDNAHLQTRMARQLKNGNFLVPHLLAFAVKEYSPDGQVVRVLRTDLDSIGGRPAENWPFTAIRLDNGNTVVSLTHGNKVVELNPAGRSFGKSPTRTWADYSTIHAEPKDWPMATRSWAAMGQARGHP
ncbi:MAG: hypothetical protein U1G07_09585 [Verrucomicrobiota bacterium]